MTSDELRQSHARAAKSPTSQTRGGTKKRSDSDASPKGPIQPLPSPRLRLTRHEVMAGPLGAPARVPPETSRNVHRDGIGGWASQDREFESRARVLPHHIWRGWLSPLGTNGGAR